MKKILDIFNQDNILIILGIIVIIVVALIIILILEKRSSNKYLLEIKKIDEAKKKGLNKPKRKVKEEKIIIKEEQSLISKEIKKEQEKRQEEVIYKEEKETASEAKKAINEAAKKMVYEEKVDIVGPTYFEKQQEETSIISYDELINSKALKDYENNLLKDEGNEPITIDEIMKEKELIKEEKEEETQEEKEELPFLEEGSYYINSESKKFKNSLVISPVYGVKKDIIYKKEYNELGETVNIQELDLEIQKTEEFLRELKKLKDKLK